MDTRATIFDIQRTDDVEWLALQREEAAHSDCYSEDDKIEITDAINQRCSYLNGLELSKKQA